MFEQQGEESSTMKKRWMIVSLAMAAGMLVFVVRWANSHSRPRHTLGLTNGRLAECLETPNCISTQADNPEQLVSPMLLNQSVEEVQQQLEAIICSMPRSRMVTSVPGYFHAEFRSLILGFVDDVEFAIDESQKLIHFRSASRVGKSDLGVNRDRWEAIRSRYQSR